MVKCLSGDDEIAAEIRQPPALGHIIEVEEMRRDRLAAHRTVDDRGQDGETASPNEANEANALRRPTETDDLTIELDGGTAANDAEDEFGEDKDQAGVGPARILEDAEGKSQWLEVDPRCGRIRTEREAIDEGEAAIVEILSRDGHVVGLIVLQETGAEGAVRRGNEVGAIESDDGQEKQKTEHPR